MGLSGRVAGGFQRGLVEEMTRQALEAARAQQVQMQERQLQMQQARLDEDLRRRQFDEGRIKRADQIAEAEGVAESADAQFDPSSPLNVEMSESQAGALKGTPLAGRVQEIPTLDAKPTVPGMSAMGPREIGVRRLAPTGEQQGARRITGLRKRVSGELAGATDEGTRRSVAAEAFGEGVDVPAALMKPTAAETATAQAQADEREFGQWKRQQDYNEGQIRSRPARPVREALTPGQAFNATRSLRNDFVRETSAAREVQNQFRLMQSALEAARRGDMAAGSQGVLVTFQKILDPTSVVRESEYARSASGQSLLSRIEGAAQKLAQGGAGVPVQELEAFVKMAEQFARNQATAAKETQAQINAIAQEYDIDPAHITREYGAEPTGANPPAERPADLVYDPKTKTLRPRGGV
jgi:hypothetical protein